MYTPILATKLFVPVPRPNVVLRPRLIERLNEGLHRKLTLISAPAGFGKTTLVSDWLSGLTCPAAWLSLDEGDNDPIRFLTYLVAALQTLAPTIGQGTMQVLQSHEPGLGEAMLTALLNEISVISHHFVLVLDDYHIVDAMPIDHALTYLLEHLPPQMHLVVTTRDDPQLPVARLRARGQLTELRAKDLRFNSEEAAQFLNHGMGLNLSAAVITALEDRTEGWIAGLQLAGLSMQSHQDIPEFIRAFSGDNRYIADYLIEEVLRHQPESLRDFLLRTSVLDRLNGPLCDAVTGQEGGKARLEALERGNLFVVPLDDKRYWYRYHHLFADVLSAHLVEEQSDQVPILHRRASEWYERNGSASDAIRHALTAEDFERAADLIEQAAPVIQRSRQEATLLGWLQALPDGLFNSRPVLSLLYAGTLLQTGRLDGVEARLLNAEQWLDTIGNIHAQPDAPSTSTVVLDDEEFYRLRGSIAVYRAALALALGDLQATVIYARQALEVIPAADQFRRGGAAALLGLAAWTNGDLEEAHRTYAEGMASLQRAGYIADVIGGATTLADIRIAQGRLREAMRTYERALQLAAKQDTPVLRGTADMHVGMSTLYRERNDLKAATQLLLRSKELGEQAALPKNRGRWCIAMARIREAEGDLDEALDLLHEAERLYFGDFSPNVQPIHALKTRVWVAQGRLAEALDWVREQNISVEDELSYLREFEHITLVRVLLAGYKSDHDDLSLSALMGLLERLLQAAEAGGRMGSVIEILLLQALAHHMQGDSLSALAPLERALTLAEPEGYVRLFVDEGEPMAVLLENAKNQGIALTYVRHLLSALDKGENKTPVDQAQGLAEPLSARELEVLRLFATDLNGPEIARELIVSLSTLRTHTQNIYTKLGVNSRRTAVRRAEELDLL